MQKKNIFQLLSKQVKFNSAHHYLDSVDDINFTIGELHNFVLKFNTYLKKK